MNSESAWAQAAQQFQQGFGEQWARTLQSFSGLDPNAATPSLPQLSFSPGKLQALQAATVTNAEMLKLEKRIGALEPDPLRSVERLDPLTGDFPDICDLGGSHAIGL